MFLIFNCILSGAAVCVCLVRSGDVFVGAILGECNVSISVMIGEFNFESGEAENLMVCVFVCYKQIGFLTL